MCSRVPLPPYIKEERGRPAGPCRARQERGVLLGLQVLVGFHQKERGGRKERERERERGVAPPPLVLFGLPMGGVRHLLLACPLSPLRPMLAHYFPGGFR